MKEKQKWMLGQGVWKVGSFMIKVQGSRHYILSPNRASEGIAQNVIVKQEPKPMDEDEFNDLWAAQRVRDLFLAGEGTDSESSAL